MVVIVIIKLDAINAINAITVNNRSSVDIACRACVEWIATNGLAAQVLSMLYDVSTVKIPLLWLVAGLVALSLAFGFWGF